MEDGARHRPQKEMPAVTTCRGGHDRIAVYRAAAAATAADDSGQRVKAHKKFDREASPKCPRAPIRHSGKGAPAPCNSPRHKAGIPPQHQEPARRRIVRPPAMTPSLGIAEKRQHRPKHSL